MTRVVFATWDGGGNVPPALLLAGELAARGASVRFLGHEGQRRAIESAGFPFEAYSHGREWSVLSPRNPALAALAYAAVFTDRGIGRSLIESLEREPADEVVIDGLLIGAMDAAARANIAYRVLVHTLRGVMIRTLTTGPLAVIMRLNRLDPARLYAAARGAIVGALASLDPGRSAAPASATYVGPIVPPVDAPAAPESPPVVLVSLSTTYIRGQRELLQTLLDVLADRQVHTILTTGPAVDPDDLAAPPNAEVHRFVPHRELLPRASLVVGHGGHATTMLALAHGVPLLVIPMNPTFDQPEIGRIVAQHGAGLTLPRRSRARRIAEAIDALLASEDYAGNAGQIGAELRRQHGAQRASGVILGSGRPR